MQGIVRSHVGVLHYSPQQFEMKYSMSSQKPIFSPTDMQKNTEDEDSDDLKDGDPYEFCSCRTVSLFTAW